MTSLENKLAQYHEKGYVVIDDFLPEKIAEELNNLYSSQKNWDHASQVRQDHYKHVFATKSQYLPKGDEPYLAKFDRSRDLEKNLRINEIFTKFFHPTLKEFSGVDLKKFDMRCYRLKQGDYYRSHIDDYAGSIGCVFYINKKWIWDWGGLLQVNSFDGSADFVDTIFPKFNRLVLLDHKKFKFPHFVSTISEYAVEPRYSIVSFNS